MDTPWRIELFGTLQAAQAERTISRFQTAKTAALLAYLALQIPKAVNRESLADLLWADADPAAARNSLRVALNSLRRQLEPPGVPPGAVLSADRLLVSLNRRTCITDVSEFDELLRLEKMANSDAERESLLQQSAALYNGELLEGWTETWLISERMRYAESCIVVLKQLVRMAAQRNDFETSLKYAQKALHIDKYREGAHRDLMRLYVALGRPQAALRQYDELERLLVQETGVSPSQATRDLAAQIAGRGGDPSDALPLEWETRDGEDIVLLPTVETASAPVVSTPSTGRLPMQFTRFFGRESEITRLCQVAAPATLETRLRHVSLTGAAGIGKTRLALEVCYRLRESYRDRIWFVPLSDLEDASRIALFVANNLQIPLLAEDEPTAKIVSFLQDTPALFVLDNVEQLLDEEGDPDGMTFPAASLTGDLTRFLLTLTQSLPCLIVMITTRRRLEIEGEQEIMVLPLPSPNNEQTPQDLMRYASVQLFVDRAQTVRADFQVTSGNALAVAALCQRLEGIPLAIELAAAWATTLTPAQMLERLSRRFDLLVSRRRDRNARHLTLRAAIDYSYELLPPMLKRFFRQMTVFRGGMLLESAEEVAGTPDALDMLMQLQQRSLILAEESGAAMRFRLLETLREYGWERLTSVEQAQLEKAHTDCYVRVADTAAGKLTGTDAALWLRSLDGEKENLRVALDRLIADKEGVPALRMVSTLWRFWYSRGYLEEGLRYLEEALRLTNEAAPPILHAEVLEGVGRMASATGDHRKAIEHLQNRLALVKSLNNEAAVETTLTNLFLAASDAGDRARALAFCAELWERVRASGDRWAQFTTLFHLAQLTDKPEPLLQECLALCRALGVRWHTAMTLDAIADTQTGDLANLHKTEARTLLAAAASSAIGASYLNLGIITLGQGDYPAAHDLLCDALGLFREERDEAYEAVGLENLAAVALRQRDKNVARQYATEALRIRREQSDSDGIAYCEMLLSAS